MNIVAFSLHLIIAKQIKEINRIDVFQSTPLNMFSPVFSGVLMVGNQLVLHHDVDNRLGFSVIDYRCRNPDFLITTSGPSTIP